MEPTDHYTPEENEPAGSRVNAKFAGKTEAGPVGIVGRYQLWTHDALANANLMGVENGLIGSFSAEVRRP